MENFTVRAYGFQELAQHYFPNNQPGSAAAQLRRWIKVEPLRTRLAASGWQAGQKILTPRQVEIIIRHVGEP